MQEAVFRGARSTRSLGFFAAFLLLAGSPAAAGPNVGGTVFVTWNPGFPFQSDSQYSGGVELG